MHAEAALATISCRLWVRIDSYVASLFYFIVDIHFIKDLTSVFVCMQA